MRILLCAAALAAMLSSQALATFDLRITEVWPGSDSSPITNDWFELTNYGDMAWDESVHGELWYDDNSANPNNSVLLTGISSILPGQSVIYLEDADTTVDEADPSDDADGLFVAAWVPVKGPQIIGGFTGSGVGLSSSNGDAVNIWLGDPRITVNLLDSVSFPQQGLFVDGYSRDIVLDSWSFVGNASGAVESAVLGGDEGDLAAVASPGTVPVPEPSCIALLGLTLVGLAIRRP